MTRMIISGPQLLHERNWLSDQALVIDDNKIKAIIPAKMIEHHLPAKHYHFASDCYLVPGFMDMHIHGANGKDVMDGTTEAINEISNSLVKEGVTGFLATTLSSDETEITHVLKSIVRANPKGATLLGIHLEGPFLSPLKAGAHNKDALIQPQVAMLERLQSAAQHQIKLLTLAPELVGGSNLISAAKRLDMIVSIGHTNASYEEAMQVVSLGASHATHLFNGMCGIHQRKPGVSVAMLLSNEINAELIVDGLHLHPAMVELAFHLKGKDRLLLVTDAMRAKCLGDGEYELGKEKVSVKEGKATLADGTLAGSTLTMPRAIKNMVEFSHCSLSDAITMASENPAKSLGLFDHKGSLEKNKDADIVLLNKNLDVLMTVCGGEVVYRDEHVQLEKEIVTPHQ